MDVAYVRLGSEDDDEAQKESRWDGADRSWYCQAYYSYLFLVANLTAARIICPWFVRRRRQRLQLCERLARGRAGPTHSSSRAVAAPPFPFRVGFIWVWSRISRCRPLPESRGHCTVNTGKFTCGPGHVGRGGLRNVLLAGLSRAAAAQERGGPADNLQARRRAR